jgi:hypothetical protein
MSYDQLKERCKSHILYRGKKNVESPIQYELDTLSNLPFKVTFLIYNVILNTNKRCLVFSTSGFVLNLIYSSMLSIL